MKTTTASPADDNSSNYKPSKKYVKLIKEKFKIKMSNMTNKQRWDNYTSNLSSPQSFVDWGYLFLISSCLQRRVWLSASNQPCFPNMYVILVGEPGIGKGLVIREVNEFLRFWKKDDIKPKTEGMNKDQALIAQALHEEDTTKAQQSEFQGKGQGSKDILKPLAFSVAADATTYEALVDAVSQSYRRINYLEWNETHNKFVSKIIGHSSITFALQELGSLLRKHTSDTVNYLLGLYDCPLDYEYLTRTRGKERVRRACLNLLAGTTPSFMQGTFDDKLVGEGFTSRVFYIFAKKNRKNQFFIPELTEEQKTAKTELLNHIKELASLYGQCTIDKDTMDYLQTWWHEQEENKHKRINQSLQMMPYYARKNIHVMKVAMAYHFGESIDKHIPLSAFTWAIQFLEKAEMYMHLAITLEGSTPFSKCCQRILEFLRNGQKKSYVEIAITAMVGRKELEECLTFLQDTEQINVEAVDDEKTAKTMLWYQLTK
jgi:hypothetical protein